MRVACVLITHLRAKAEMRRKGRERGKRSEKRENSLHSSSSERLAAHLGEEEALEQACATASDAQLQEPSTLIVKRGRWVRVLTERYRQTYNRIRPHSSLGYRPPAPEAHMPADPVPVPVGLT